MTDIMLLQKQLVSMIGITGHEENRAALIASIVKPYCDGVYIDNMFNVIAHKKGNGTRVMLSAHQDTIGFIVTFIERNGYLRFECMGGINPLTAINTIIQFENGVIGRVCLTKEADDTGTKIKDLKYGSLCIDIGANSREEAESLISIGDVAQYAAETIAVGPDTIMSPYLDDLIGCVIEIKALERLKDTVCDNDIYFVFSTQEEYGHRGAKAASRSINPQFGLAIDVTRTGDCRGNSLYMATKMGDGAAIKVRDSAVLCTLSVISLLKEVAAENGIPYQIEVLQNGGTDTEAIQNNRSGAAAGGISIGSRYTHSPSEMASISDINACVNLLCAVLKKDLNGGLL